MTQLPTEILALDLRLVGIDPPIWRRVEVPASYSLAELHQVVQKTMQWADSHLHEFSLGERTFQAPHPEARGEDTTEVRLIDLGLQPGAGLRYVYDFGDEWTLAITVWDRQFGPVGPPTCTGGARAAPPEDAGGAHQYAEMIAAVNDPTNHPEPEELLEWLPDGFDPEAFDQARVNTALRTFATRAI